MADNKLSYTLMKELPPRPPDNPSSACFHGGAFFQSIGEDFQQLERRDAIINADVLDAWFPPAPGVIQVLRDALPWVIRTSPPTAGTGMIDAISRIRGINVDNICIGAGSSDLIYLAFHQWIHGASRTLVLDPMYGEYRHILEHVLQAKIDQFPLSRKHNYLVDLDRLLHAAGQEYDLIVLVNPNSPTGQHIPAEELQNFLEKVSGKTKVWIDETYVEYVGTNHSLEQFAAASENVIVCKSMSKVYALSGVRAAYLCGPVHLMQQLRVHNPPWAVSLPAQIAAVYALNDPGYYEQCYTDTARFRTELATELRKIQAFEVIPGVANFLLCHILPGFPDAPTFIEQCRQKGLFIRNAQNMGLALDERVVRIAVKDQKTNRKMIDIFKEVLL